MEKSLYDKLVKAHRRKRTWGKIKGCIAITALVVGSSIGINYSIKALNSKEYKIFTTYTGLTAEFVLKGGLYELPKGKQHVHDWVKENIPDVEDRLKKVHTEEKYHKAWDWLWE